MSAHAYMPLYVDDFEAATAHLSLEEDGIYNRLLRLAWRMPGCSLPADHAWIARKVRLSTQDFERVALPVLAEFFTLQRGRYFQKRQRREYDAISRKKTARAAAGKMGGTAKAMKVKEKSSGNASNLPAHTRASPEPEPESSLRLDSLSREADFVLRPLVSEDAMFERWWSAYPSKTGKRPARAAFGRALGRIEDADPISVLLLAVEKAKGSRRWREGYIPNPATWLNQDRWKDELDDRNGLGGVGGNHGGHVGNRIERPTGMAGILARDRGFLPD